MVNYGSPCKNDSECPSKICEMTYKNRVPDTRRCVDGSKSEKSESVTDTEKELEFGGECQGDSDCSSGLCEPNHCSCIGIYRGYFILWICVWCVYE